MFKKNFILDVSCELFCYWLVGQKQEHWQNVTLWAAEMKEVEKNVLSEANTVSSVDAVTESCEVKPRVEFTELNSEVEMVIDCMLVSLMLFNACSFIWVGLPVREIESEVGRDIALNIEPLLNDHLIVESVCIMSTEVWVSCVDKVLKAASS